MEGYIKFVFFYAEDLLTFVYMYKCVCKQKTNKQKNNIKKTWRPLKVRMKLWKCIWYTDVFNTYKIMGSQSEGCAIWVFIHTHAHMRTQISKKLKCSVTVHILSYSIKELPLVTHKSPLRWENNWWFGFSIHLAWLPNTYIKCVRCHPQVPVSSKSTQQR